MRIVPQLFTACQMLVISDMADTRVGTITAPLDRYMEWKTTDGSYESTAFADFETSSMVSLSNIVSLILLLILLSRWEWIKKPVFLQAIINILL